MHKELYRKQYMLIEIIFKPTLQCCHLEDISSYNIINRQNAVLSCNSLSDILYMHALNETPIGTLWKILLIETYHSINLILEISQTEFYIIELVLPHGDEMGLRPAGKVVIY